LEWIYSVLRFRPLLEPRSMLERITDFMSHPDLIFGQVISVLLSHARTHISAVLKRPSARRALHSSSTILPFWWHIKPKGVKKPYNPVLGEFFRCRYDYPMAPRRSILPSKYPPSAYLCVFLHFSGQQGSFGSLVNFGQNPVPWKQCYDGHGRRERVLLMGKPEDGEYVISMPNMYARSGYIIREMVLELGDMCAVKCEKTGWSVTWNSRPRASFGGYNGVSGRVKQGNTDIAEVSGLWSSSMEYKSLKTNDKRVLFDAAKETLSRNSLWTKLTDAIHHKDMEAATDAKSAVENAQREAARKRKKQAPNMSPVGIALPTVSPFVLTLATSGGNGIPSNPDAAVKFVEEWIWPKQTAASLPHPAKLLIKLQLRPQHRLLLLQPRPSASSGADFSRSPGAISATSS
ncbi:OSBP family, partial [Rhizoctonia solani]